MKRVMQEEAQKGNNNFSHFGPGANLLERLEATFREFGETGRTTTRHYIHDASEAQCYGSEPGTFTDWEETPADVDLLFYEGLHGAVVTDDVNIAQYADLKIGVTPVIHLEWIQKLHRDRFSRGYTPDAIMDTILRRMPDYINYICPQFARRTSTSSAYRPSIRRTRRSPREWIPTADESMVVIRFANPHGINFSYLLTMIPDSFMSRANSIVIPGGERTWPCSWC